ncbi:MAG: glycoside hydrolase/phage tail family protein [Xanthobacter sp.]
MATLLLGAAGGLVGGALFGPIGAVAGRALGALGGAVMDQTLFGGNRATSTQGPRLSDLEVMASTEGTGIPRLYGRTRLSGQVIWATKLKEVAQTETQSVGGKGGSLMPTASNTTYSYYASFAVALCEGPVSRIGRIWADGKLLNTRRHTVRLHTGAPDQAPDPWIEAKQGAQGTPAYRGIAYVMFENLDLTSFGNRLPQITVEVERAVGRLEQQIRAVTMIPGATEFGYATATVRQAYGTASYGSENRHVSGGASDFNLALDQLLATCPNMERVSLVASWFADDLRAGSCKVRPRTEKLMKTTTPVEWSVGGLTRLLAPSVSTHDERPAYGGTPSDLSVIQAIQRMHAHGLKVTLNPFVMMDVPEGNSRPDPWSDAQTQPAYPWRGRIVCDPAPGRTGSVEGTAECRAQLEALFGQARPGDFTRLGNLVLYHGPSEWSLRRMVLHYAHLAVAAGGAAGGVEAFLIGSEMVALTRLRDEAGHFPAAEELARLAADVRAIVGPDVRISYGADWTEYGAQDLGGGNVAFPLDALWASDAVDFIGIDYYPPLTDWRDGATHLDAALAQTIHDPAYLKGRLRAGEAYEWYYADDDARAAQHRLSITDGDYGEPWIYRQKDIWNWWAQAHHPRANGVRQETATGWMPGSKPIRLMEAGCAAVDKGPNRSSAFPDAKSSENALPPFSSGQRDDTVQRRCNQAILATFDRIAGADDADNPPAPLYGGRMVEEGCVYFWTWDARPYPQFPLLDDVWGDAPNWETGHWLNGRLGSAPLDGLVETLCADFGADAVESGALSGAIEGYVVQQPMTARAALEPLARAFGFEASDENGQLAFRPRGGGVVVDLDGSALVRENEASLFTLTRAQESELPVEVQIGFIDPQNDYRQASISSRRLVGGSHHVAQASLAVVAPANVMARAADIWLQDLWAGRESFSFTLPPSAVALMPGDVVRLSLDGREHLLKITRVEEAEARTITAHSIEPAVFEAPLAPQEAGTLSVPPELGPPQVAILDLPVLTAQEPLPLQYLAAAVSPWPGTLALWRSTDGASFEVVAPITSSAAFGTLLEEMKVGPFWRFDHFNSLLVQMDALPLQSASPMQVLDGANVLVLMADGRAPELIQYSEAELVDAQMWRLRGLLRGLGGTEAAGHTPWSAGTRLVRLDATLLPIAKGAGELGRRYIYRIGPVREDHGGENVTEVTAQVGDAALRPLSPVHLRVQRGVQGVEGRFTRRTRLDGDGWETLEVPLGEAEERYRVEVLKDEDVVRSFEITSPAFTYDAAQELADFGAEQRHLTFRIAQMSQSVGPGAVLTRTVAV